MGMDEAYMLRCLDLAVKGFGRVSPNPMVGCIIVHNGQVIGQGYHYFYGGPHAEVNAIASVKRKELLSASTLYVNLEPCSHHGKTPPCADYIISQGIPRVVIGSADPHPKVAGKGIGKLKASGIQVQVGILEAECQWVNRRFFSFHILNRPYVILKWASSMDGY
ncbi:MAG: bifunctional diaminohydroxyphosphoribosylaminopyrimidine deaminase/5-amino-6-(5-phosphoribosylamino)uracil reductase RibD, partial [Bacteroidales bacterium]|nr:bifunctional diaminohydroxyphosphoribosylaminopyrimidine deaminase/5-amino-6-(5-phosphoribosylamino)uracil reductase RibD [Bacteroidales bacterium]